MPASGVHARCNALMVSEEFLYSTSRFHAPVVEADFESFAFGCGAHRSDHDRIGGSQVAAPSLLELTAVK